MCRADFFKIFIFDNLLLMKRSPIIISINWWKIKKVISLQQLKRRKFNANPFNDPVVQLVRMPPCHGGGRGFESRPDRNYNINVVQKALKRMF